MKTFPTLYKKSNTGKIQEWTIAVDNCAIVITHGQKGGKLQVTEDTVKEGKNLGKANATTAQEQALSEAESKWTKQLKKGYNESLEAASKGETDAIIEGGIFPQLSINKSHPKDPILAKYLKYPCIIQPKLDGACCIAHVKDGIASLWSRTRKPINCVPHIVEQLEARFPVGEIILHGELYEHDKYKDSFQDLMSVIRQDEPDSEGLYKDIQLHVYDLPKLDVPGYKKVDYNTRYEDRYQTYIDHLSDCAIWTPNLVPVKGYGCSNLEDVLRYYNLYLEDGYEGGMAKNTKAPYEAGKRSRNILKMKEFYDSEGIVTGFEEGRRREANAVGSFLCRWKEDNLPEGANKDVNFKVRMKCSLKQKQEFFKNFESYRDKALTFTYKRITPDGKPYIPVGKGFSPDKQG